MVWMVAWRTHDRLPLGAQVLQGWAALVVLWGLLPLAGLPPLVVQAEDEPAPGEALLRILA